MLETPHPFASAVEMCRLLRSGRLTPLELMRETLGRIERLNASLNAFVCLRAEEALAEAALATQALSRGEDPGPLAGLPLAVKDLEDVAGLPTTFGSIPFKDHVARVDSIQVSRLKKAGAIVVGKTNTPEFGFTGFTKNRLFGVTRNPWNLERTPGGSSGGSAAAVASGMVPLATGSDAGGSIRIPACYCGCFGLKPTYGLIPLGPLPLLYTTRTWTLGPITRSVEDAALYLDCTAGYHPADPDSLPPPPGPFLDRLSHIPRGLRLAFSLDLGYARVERPVAALAQEGAAVFEELGHHVEIWEGSFPEVGETWAELMNLELYAQLHEELEQIRPELGRTLAASMDQAKTLGVADWIRHQRVRTALNQTLEGLFKRFDLLLTPAMPTEAFGAKGPPPREIDGHPVPLLGAVAFTYPFNLSGHPAATVRTGLTPAGLPAGLQIIGPRHRDDLVLQAAHAFEKARPWHATWPDL